MPDLPAYWTIVALVVGFIVGVVVKMAPVVVSFMTAKLDRDKFTHQQNLDRLAQFSAGVDREIERFEKMTKVLQGEPKVPPSALLQPSGSADRTLADIQRARIEASQQVPVVLGQLTDLRRQQEGLRKRLLGDPNQDFERQFAPLVRGTEDIHEQLADLLNRFVALPRIFMTTVEPKNSRDGDLWIQVVTEQWTPQGLIGSARPEISGNSPTKALEEGAESEDGG